MARLQSHFRLLVIFGFGYLSCFIYLNNGGIEDDHHEEAPGVAVAQPITNCASPIEPRHKDPPQSTEACDCNNEEEVAKLGFLASCLCQ